MSTLAKECGAKSQDGFTKARLTEFMPPSFDCQYTTLRSSKARIYVRINKMEDFSESEITIFRIEKVRTTV